MRGNENMMRFEDLDVWKRAARLSMDIGYIPKDIGNKWIAVTTEISAMLSGLIKTKRGFLKNSLASFIALFL